MNLPVVFSRMLDFVLPPRCLKCLEVVQTAHSLCSRCWSDARFISAPYCACCGTPFEYDVPDTAICLNCARKKPPFKQARCAFAYDDFSRQLVLSFKHGDHIDLAPAMGNWMARAGGDLWADCDVIIPVPLHWRRQVSRRFNQSAVLAQEVSKRVDIPVRSDLLKRHRATPSQGHLSRMARQNNLKGAFNMDKNLQGERVVLIDDVFTTGATLLNCCEVLFKGGASQVSVLTFARVFHNNVT